jgi:hypothetical protein
MAGARVMKVVKKVKKFDRSVALKFYRIQKCLAFIQSHHSCPIALSPYVYNNFEC